MIRLLTDFIHQKFDEEAGRYKPIETIDPIEQCSIVGCCNKKYAKGLCNAHYIRQRKGIDPKTPIKYRSSDTRCGVCSEPVGAKGGWGMCKTHYRHQRRWVMKRSIVEYLGGRCSKCDCEFHPAVFDFHHIDGKDDAISAMFEAASIDRIVHELTKCEMLCANCHRMEHHGHN